MIVSGREVETSRAAKSGERHGENGRGDVDALARGTRTNVSSSRH